MAAESDNLVLILLREIRADIARIFQKLEQHDRRFDKVDKDFDTFKYQLTHTFGLAGMANLQSQQADAKADAVLERQMRLEAMVSDMDRRLKRIEEPSGA